jgi:superfamily II DNA or RNA helicase
MSQRGPVINALVESTRKGNLHVKIYPNCSEELLREYGAPGRASVIAEAFQGNIISGTFHLVTQELGERLPANLSFFRELGKSIFTHWLLAARAGATTLAPPPPGTMAPWVLLARTVSGISTVSEGVLEWIWVELRRNMLLLLRNNKLSFREWLLTHNDPWDQIGDMVLRLEVSSDDPARPFVLHCHVVDGLSGANRVRLTPVGVYILGISRVEGFGKYLYSRLCSAAALSPIVGRLLASQEIFSPCHLIPRDAHAFLLTIPALEELGIKVQVPEWWHARRQPRFGVRTRIGTRAPTPLGVETLLDVSTAFLVDERELSEAEWRKLMSKSGDGLVYVADAWREVNQQAVYQADRGFETTAQMQARGGVTATEALAILTDRAHADPGASEVFTPGPWMAEALGAMGRQDLRRAAEPGPELHCQLRPYQRQGVTWMSMMLELGLGALLADDMGLGKTVQVIALILSLKRRESPGPHLIVAPASLLANWREEIERWTRPPLPVAVVHHEHDSTTDAAEPLIVLTSYSTLLRRPELQSRQWGLLVLDEAQTIKNAWAKMTHTLKRMQARMRVCLTGTPVENSLGDLWSLMDFLNPGLLGTETEFAARVRDVRSDVQGVLEPLRRQVRPLILRRLKTDAGIADTLPQKIEMPVYCGLTTMQADLYLQAIAEVREHLRSARPRERSGLVLALLTRLKQVCNHPAQFRKHLAWDTYSSAKFIRLRQLGETIAASGEKALVFTQYQELTGPLARLLAEPFGRPGLVLDGHTPINQRQELVAQFQDPDGPPFMVMTIKAGGTGLNLTAASQVIHFDQWWNPAAENQATDRAFRIGQHRNVFVHKFVVQGTVEQKIQAKIESKRNLVSDLFADDEDPLRLGELGADEVLSLVALDTTQAREEAAS